MRQFALILALWFLPAVAHADAALTRLADLLAIRDYVDITREEGLRDGRALSLDMLGREADTSYAQQLGKVYDPEILYDAVYSALEEGLETDAINAALNFFDTDSGDLIVRLELAARQAMSDPALEQAARVRWAKAGEDHPWLIARIDEMTRINDLLERNVTGGLTSNLQFLQGLVDGEAIEMTEEEILQDTWAQEQEIRDDTLDWLGAYMLLAYEPLSQEDLEAYIAFWQTEQGRALNAALFDGFNQMYNQTAYAMGRVLALNTGAQDL